MNRMTIWFTSDTHGYLYDTDFVKAGYDVRQIVTF